MTFEEAKKILTEKKQEHILKDFDKLTADQQAGLLRQIADLDWDTIALVTEKEKAPEGISIEDPTAGMKPLKAVSAAEIEANRAKYEEAGLKELGAGKVGAVLLAGGMGTRLGFDKPKGELNVGLTRTLYIFQCLINSLSQVEEAAGHPVPLYIMTSEKNDEETRRFFAEQDYFGYPADYVKFFVQEMAAAVDYEGKLLLEEPGRLATSPNGNGGWFSSLAKAGLLEDVHAKGVEWLNIFAVDNVLQKMADPAFVGATILAGADSGSKVVHKAEASEKVGVLCERNGHPAVVEYYEMGDQLAAATGEDGDLLYAYGVILNYIFRVSCLEEIMENHMPVHVVEKKIPYYRDGEHFAPTEPNGYKFETLVVDMIAMMDSNLPYEVVREKEFAPIKNLHGTDSLDSARELLQKNGVEL